MVCSIGVPNDLVLWRFLGYEGGVVCVVCVVWCAEMCEGIWGGVGSGA